MARYLVTGGSGFIGTHLIDALVARGDTVANIDPAPPMKADHAPFHHALNLMDTEAVHALVAGFRPDVIVNLAAVADILKGREAFAVNTQGLENLLTASADWPEKPRLVHASTQMVAEPGFTPAHPRDYAPYTEYGESKADSEEVLHNWPGDCEWVIIRPTVVWGPKLRTFAKATWLYLQKRWYFVPSRHSSRRTYSYVGNLVEQFLAACELPAEAVNRKTFYGGDAVMDSAQWLDAFALGLTGKRARRFPYWALKALALGGDLSAKIGGPSPINSGRLYRMTQDHVADLAESHRVLGTGSHTLEEGVARTVTWLRTELPGQYPPR